MAAKFAAIGNACSTLPTPPRQEYDMDRKTFTLMTAGLLVFAASAQPRAAQAGTPQAAIRSAVGDFLTAQTGGLPGQVEHGVGSIDPRLTLPACAALDVFTPPGARLWGKTNVGVRCASPAWTIYVPVTVKVTGSYLVTTRALPPGHVITAADTMATFGDLTLLPAGVAQDPAQVVGRSVSGSLAAGQPL
ncbi:MAG: flagellar basal body P-ring formation chaperone FlgA, partial [Burkholderiales bacterium]|nr:flagellar basal body P-ring formation chaperone FlgA [Burkholderiales bacterium]